MHPAVFFFLATAEDLQAFPLGGRGLDLARAGAGVPAPEQVMVKVEGKSRIARTHQGFRAGGGRAGVKRLAAVLVG